jgi:hypothetical protein
MVLISTHQPTLTIIKKELEEARISKVSEEQSLKSDVSMERMSGASSCPFKVND